MSISLISRVRTHSTTELSLVTSHLDALVLVAVHERVSGVLRAYSIDPLTHT